MGHYHLPVAPDAEVIRLIEPLFDAVIQLRVDANGPQQRWKLTDGSGSTDGLPLG